MTVAITDVMQKESFTAYYMAKHISVQARIFTEADNERMGGILYRHETRDGEIQYRAGKPPYPNEMLPQREIDFYHHVAKFFEGMGVGHIADERIVKGYAADEFDATQFKRYFLRKHEIDSQIAMMIAKQNVNLVIDIGAGFSARCLSGSHEYDFVQHVELDLADASCLKTAMVNNFLCGNVRENHVAGEFDIQKDSLTNVLKQLQIPKGLKPVLVFEDCLQYVKGGADALARILKEADKYFGGNCQVIISMRDSYNLFQIPDTNSVAMPEGGYKWLAKSDELKAIFKGMGGRVYGHISTDELFDNALDIGDPRRNTHYDRTAIYTGETRKQKVLTTQAQNTLITVKTDVNTKKPEPELQF